ncbi:hypothetical protein [Nostoc sp. KVJ20]|nr:hypothetical protein [Nostoc sp. KVJ20]
MNLITRSPGWLTLTGGFFGVDVAITLDFYHFPRKMLAAPRKDYW